MGKRISMKITERLQSDLSEDKVSPQTSNATTEKHEANPQPPSTVDESSSGKNEEQANHGEDGHHSNIPSIRKSFQYVSITSQGFFNGVVALFTALTCWVTYWQYTAQVVDQRAWVATELLVSDPTIPEVGQKFHIRIVFKNSGKTPARDVLANVVADPIVMPGKPNFSYQGEEIAHVGMIAPNGTNFAILRPVKSKSKGPDAPLTADLLTLLQKDEQRLYVHGHVSYADIFGECHWVEFCFYLLAPDLSSFAVCPNHNDTGDKECKENQ